MSGKRFKEEEAVKSAVELKLGPESPAEPEIEIFVAPEPAPEPLTDEKLETSPETKSEAPPESLPEPLPDAISDAVADKSGFPDLGERYEVLEQIGAGGMGTVWKVRDLTLDRILAIKLLRSEMLKDETAVKRFEQEARLATDLTHMNIASIYGPGKDKTGQPFIVMNYIDGESLADILAREGKLDEARAMDIFHQICDALAHSHMKGVIHRDIKPSNIIISKTAGGGDVVHVVDFGIAKSIYGDVQSTQALTRTEDTFGSPLYMSPEQCLGEEVTERSDIYSLGCVLCEMLTGKPPFTEKNPVKLLIQHLTEIPDLVALSLSKRALVMVCLQKRPEARPHNIDAIKEYLNRDYQDMSSAAGGKNYLGFLGVLPGVIACSFIAPVILAGPSLATHLFSWTIVVLILTLIMMAIWVANETSAIVVPISKTLAHSLLVALVVIILQLPFMLYVFPSALQAPLSLIVSALAFWLLYKPLQKLSLLNRAANWRTVTKAEKRLYKFRLLFGRMVFYLEANIALFSVMPMFASCAFLLLSMWDIADARFMSVSTMFFLPVLALYFVGVFALLMPSVVLLFEVQRDQIQKNLRAAFKSATLISLAWGALFALPVAFLWEPAAITCLRATYSQANDTGKNAKILKESIRLPQTELGDFARVLAVNGLKPSERHTADAQTALKLVIGNDESSVPLLKANAYLLLLSNKYTPEDRSYIDRSLEQLQLDKQLKKKPYKSFKGDFARLNAPMSANEAAIAFAWLANNNGDLDRRNKLINFARNSGEPLGAADMKEIELLCKNDDPKSKAINATIGKE